MPDEEEIVLPDYMNPEVYNVRPVVTVLGPNCRITYKHQGVLAKMTEADAIEFAKNLKEAVDTLGQDPDREDHPSEQLRLWLDSQPLIPAV